jgi:hypothetical protein
LEHGLRDIDANGPKCVDLRDNGFIKGMGKNFGRKVHVHDFGCPVSTAFNGWVWKGSNYD